MLPLPSIAENETYIATLFDANAQQGYHLILLPGDADDANYETQLAWAQSIGGDLPNRVEQALLWQKARDQFKPDAYWSNERHHKNTSCAWVQGFHYGVQLSLRIYDEWRARAVRRSVIE